jgi:hypothetical protein
MQSQTEHLIELLDRVLEEAQLRIQAPYSDPHYWPKLEDLIAWVREKRSEAKNGTLVPSKREYTLGLSRAVTDWDSQYSKLSEAAGEADIFYRDNF